MRLRKSRKQLLAKYRTAQERYSALRKQDSLVRAIVLTFLGGVIHSLILFVYYWSEVADAIARGVVQPAFSTLSPPLFAFYLPISFIFSLAATLSFGEKRIISAYYVQLTTAAITFGVFMIVLFTMPERTIMLQTTGSMIFELFMLLALFCLFGWGISKVIRWLTGLNGTDQDLHRLTLQIDHNTEELGDLITERTFLNAHVLEEDEELEEAAQEECIILKSQSFANPKLVIVLTPESKNNHAVSILAFSAYEVKYDTIDKSDNALAELRIIKNDILGMLGSDVKVKEIGNDGRAAQVSSWEATSLVRSKVSRLDRKNIGVLIGVAASIIIGIFLTLPLADPTKDIDYSAISTIWITVVSTVVLMLIPVVLEEKRKLRKRKFESIS